MLDAQLNRRRLLGTAIKLAAVPTLAQALGVGSIGRAFAQAPAIDQTLRLAFTNPTVAFDTGREGGTPELHNLLFDGLTFYNWNARHRAGERHQLGLRSVDADLRLSPARRRQVDDRCAGHGR